MASSDAKSRSASLSELSSDSELQCGSAHSSSQSVSEVCSNPEPRSKSARLKSRSVSEFSSESDACSESMIAYSPAGAYRCANRKSLIEKREKLLKRRKVPQHELSSTLVALNDTQPVSTLPRELLIDVIEYLHPTADALDADHWIGGLFWRDVYVSSHPEWLELCLSRCAGMTADIYFTGRFALQATLPILEEHAHLVRAITYSVLRASWATDITQLLALPFPALEEIEISVTTKSERRAIVELPPESYTNLQSIYLQSCNAPHDLAAYVPLRTLEIVDSLWSISFNDLLNILVSAEQLEILVLDNCLSGLRHCPGGFPSTHPPIRSPATLSRLRELKLTTVRSSLGAQILAHIRVPNATQIEVCTYANSEYAQPSVWGVLPRNAASFSPIFTTATSISVGFPSSQRCKVVAQSATRYLCMQVRLRGHTQFGDAWEAMEGFMTTFTDAPVSRLTVTGDAGFVSGATWEHVFRSLPTLTHLDLAGRRLIGTVFAALLSASAHSGGIMCCPDLSTVRMLDYSYGGFEDPFPKATFEQVVEALRVRAEGGIRLKTLDISFSYRRWRDEEELRDSFLLGLKSLVPTVKLLF